MRERMDDIRGKAPKRLAWVLLVLAAGVMGCADSERTELTGKVTLGGQPVPGGTIKVASQDGRLTDSAAIGSDGTFRFEQAPVGVVKVAIDPPQPRGESAGSLPRGVARPPLPSDVRSNELSEAEKQAIRLVSRLPATYRDLTRTPLTVTIEKGSEPVSVELTSGAR